MARDLAKVERKLNGLIDAVAKGFRAAGLKEQMAGLETQRLDLVAKLAATDAPARPRLHPNLPQAYRLELARLREELAGGADTAAALETVRSLIDRIVLTPSEAAGFEIAVEGEAASMLALGQAAAAGDGTPKRGTGAYAPAAVPGAFSCSAMVVAGRRFDLCRTQLSWPPSRHQASAKPALS